MGTKGLVTHLRFFSFLYGAYLLPWDGIFWGGDGCSGKSGDHFVT
jgi:hypothetical protein